MQYQYIPYILPLITSAVITISLGIYTLHKRRNAKGAASFILSMFVLTIWSLANALEMSGVDFSTKLFWANVQYFAYCFSPVTLLALCMEFTGYDQCIRNKKILWFAVIPVIIIILVWTDGYHGLIRYNMHLDYSGSFPVIAKKYGPIFYIHALYSQILNITAWILLIKAVLFKNTVYRKQALSLLLGVSLIIIPNIMYILSLSPVKRFDITPLFFGPAGLIAFWGIFRYKLFDIIPVAWATVIKTIDAGVMVLDLQDRVLDINPSFERIIGCSAALALTKPVEEVCGNIPELSGACRDRSAAHREFSINIDGLTKIYEVFLSPLNDSKGTYIGRFAVAYEITEKKQAQEEFLKQQWRLAMIEERERMARDLHDNLGQVLGFINLQAQGIRQELVNIGVDTVECKLDKLINVTQSAHAGIREYIRNVRNSVYIEKNFIVALKKDISVFEEQTGLSVKLDIPYEFAYEVINPNIRINILNIVKEALNNIRKHAQAKNVIISLLQTKEQLCVTVEDDGKGFKNAINDRASKSKFGLDIMKERATEIGGEIEIKSIEGKGSRVALRVSIKGESSKNENEVNAG